MMHRKQLNRRNAQLAQVLDGGVGAQPKIGAADRFRHVGMALREPLDVHFVDEAVGPSDIRRTVLLPIERSVDHSAERRIGRTVAWVADDVRPTVAGEQAVEGVAPREIPPDGLGIRVEEQLL